MNLINRAKNMIITPKTEWSIVAVEPPIAREIVMGYVIPLALAGAIAAFIGYGLIGFSYVGVHGTIALGIYYAINKLILQILSVYITAFVVDALAPSFGSEKNFGRSMQLVAYGATPGMIAALFSILPFLAGILMLAGGIYSIYLWYLGLGPVKNTPEDKKVVYLIITFIVLIVVYFIIGSILARLLLPAFGIGYGI